MGIQFERPWVLLLVVPLIFYTIWLWRENSRLSGLRKKAALALRTMILLLLVLALAGASFYEATSRRTVVFAVDRSDSMEDGAAAAKWVEAAIGVKEADDRAGVISAGAGALAERSLSAEQPESLSLNSLVNGQWSNLAQALRLSSGLLPQGEGGRVILYSDGRENLGDMLKEGRLLRNRQIAVDVVPVPARNTVDAAVDLLQVPDRMYPGEAFDMEATVVSTAAADAVLRLYEDSRELTALSIRLEKGENRYAFPVLARDPGLHRYRAEVYMPGDEQHANNAAHAFSRVEGISKVLIVEGEPGSSRNLESALEASLIEYETIPPELLPHELADYTGYESVLLNNVPATRISISRMERLEQAVRDYGVGLMMLGGDQSFGLGGYFETPVERALPVYMELKGKREIPSLALTLVIDKSGSMAGEAIQLAQEAAVRSVDLLREKDTIGVLAFDHTPWWVVEPEKLTDKERVKSSILSISADGGTDIYPALKEAYENMAQADAQRKHIIMLTDGQSSTSESYEALTAAIVEGGITVSTVAIGDGADVQLLERIAGLGGGRFYLAADISTVPAIFSREAILMSRTYAVETTFVPTMVQGADWFPLFEQGIPSLDGYVAVSPKETAEVVLQSDEPDPVLARWRYGAGKAVAWTSDASGNWSAGWIGWSGFPAFLAETVKWTFSEFVHASYELSTRTAGENTEVTVKFNREEDRPEAGGYVLEVTDEAMNREELVLAPVVPGEYVAQLGPRAPGVYMARVVEAAGQAGEAGEPAGPATGFVIPYSPEYRLNLWDDGAARLQQLAELTGGRVLSLDHPEEAMSTPPFVVRRQYPLVRALLAAVILLWLADIAVRRLSLPWDRVFALLRAAKERIWRRAAVQAEDGGDGGGLERLRKRKETVAPLFQPSARETGKTKAPSPEPDIAHLREQGGEEQAGREPPPSQARQEEAARPTEGASAQERLNRLLEARNRRSRR